VTGENGGRRTFEVRKIREGYDDVASADERERERLDARFFQRGHGRMDVGIMEASTVPSVRDKNCR